MAYLYRNLQYKKHGDALPVSKICPLLKRHYSSPNSVLLTVTLNEIRMRATFLRHSDYEMCMRFDCISCVFGARHWAMVRNCVTKLATPPPRDPAYANVFYERGQPKRLSPTIGTHKETHHYACKVSIADRDLISIKRSVKSRMIVTAFVQPSCFHIA